MNINRIHDGPRTVNYNAPKPASEETQKAATTMAADNTDKVDIKNSAAYNGTYNKPANKTDHNEIDKDGFRKGSIRQMKNDAVREMVQSQINGQVKKGGYKPVFGKNETIMSALQAAEASSEKHDDYWGVEATAERIFTFAKSLAGEDSELLAKMKDAFLKGFAQAEGAWGRAGGGKLPSISYQTKDRVLEMFAEYEATLSGKKTDAKTDEAANKDNKNIYDTKYAQGQKLSYIGIDKFGASASTVKPEGY